IVAVLGMDVRREGVLVHLRAVTVEVAPLCNGLDFLMAMVVIGVALAWATQRRLSHRAALGTRAIILGLAGNWLRIAGTALVAEHWGARSATGDSHMMFGEGIYLVLMALFFGSVWTGRRWAEPPSARRRNDCSAVSRGVHGTSEDANSSIV